MTSEKNIKKKYLKKSLRWLLWPGDNIKNFDVSSVPLNSRKSPGKSGKTKQKPKKKIQDFMEETVILKI